MNKKSRLEKAKQCRIDYGVVFNTQKGHEVLIDLITMCHILEPAKSIDPQTLAFTEGKRSIGLRILQILNVNPEQYIKIVQNSTTE